MKNKKLARILFVCIWSLLSLLALPLRYVTAATWAPAILCGFSTPMMSVYLLLGSHYVYEPYLFGDVLYIALGFGVGILCVVFGIMAILGKKNYFPHLMLADVAASLVEAVIFAILCSSFLLGISMVWPLLLKLALILLAFFCLYKRGKSDPPHAEEAF